MHNCFYHLENCSKNFHVIFSNELHPDEAEWAPGGSQHPLTHICRWGAIQCIRCNSISRCDWLGNLANKSAQRDVSLAWAPQVLTQKLTLRRHPSSFIFSATNPLLAPSLSCLLYSFLLPCSPPNFSILFFLFPLPPTHLSLLHTFPRSMWQFCFLYFFLTPVYLVCASSFTLFLPRSLLHSLHESSVTGSSEEGAAKGYQRGAPAGDIGVMNLNKK